jgi:hypothetical protein
VKHFPAWDALAAWPFAVALALAPLQLYTVSIAGVYPSLAMAAAYGCALCLLLPGARSAPRTLQPRLVMLGWGALSVLFRSDRYFLVRILYYNAFFPALLLVAIRSGRNGAAWRAPMLVAVALAALDAGLVYLFSLQPSWEQTFYRLPAAELVINPNRLAETLQHPSFSNAFHDPKKAGGLFPNANSAAIFLGVSSLLAFGLHRVSANRWSLRASLFLLSAIPVTGSKASIVPAMVIAVWFGRRMEGIQRAIPPSLVAFGIGFFLVGSDLPSLLRGEGSTKMLETSAMRSFSYLLETAHRNFVERVSFWKESVALIAERPFAGSTGEQVRLASGEYFERHQAHNAYLRLGVHFGVPALLGAVLFHVWMLRALWSASRKLAGAPRDWALCTFLAFAWMTAQSLLSNSEPVGEFHTAPLLAGMAGVTLAISGHAGAAAPDGGLRRWSSAPAEVRPRRLGRVSP